MFCPFSGVNDFGFACVRCERPPVRASSPRLQTSMPERGHKAHTQSTHRPTQSPTQWRVETGYRPRDQRRSSCQARGTRCLAHVGTPAHELGAREEQAVEETRHLNASERDELMGRLKARLEEQQQVADFVNTEQGVPDLEAVGKTCRGARR